MNPPPILDVDVALVDNAISLWQAGELVVIPTETVYGLAADATNGEAVARIYALKSRPQFNPLIVHVSSAAMAQEYVVWNEMSDALASAFWPGPLTLVLPRKNTTISELVTAGGYTIAIRMPAHPVALQLITAFGRGIAAPSANRSGRVSPTTAQHVRDEFGTDAPFIIDGGACEIGIESTVVDCTGDAPRILRPGSVTEEMIAGLGIGDWGLESRLNGTRVAFHGEPRSVGGLGAKPPSNNPQSPIPNPVLSSPGQLASHYAPSIPVRLNVTDVRAGEALLAFGTPLPCVERTLNLSPSKNLLEAAANLFAMMRSLDESEYTAIAVMPIPNKGVGTAINDRLNRAAAPR